jgi:hypothetical protein
MATQIAIPIDTKRKTTLVSNLKRNGLTSKAFFIFCIDAYNKGEFSF